MISLLVTDCQAHQSYKHIAILLSTFFDCPFLCVVYSFNIFCFIYLILVTINTVIFETSNMILCQFIVFA